MSFKSIVKELKEVKVGFGNISRRALEGKSWRRRSRSHIVPDQAISPLEQSQQSRWANVPPELLVDIIRRVENSEPSWPARAAVVSCASVCRSWRKITKEIVQTPEQCGRLTFPLSLKQPGPRDSPIQCFIKRDRASSTYYLYYGLVPSEAENDKLLLAGHKVRRATTTDFIVSLSSDDFSRASTMHFGKLRSNFLGTKFTIFDSQPPIEATPQPNSRSPRVPVCNYVVGTISYEFNVLRSRGPRRMHCSMHAIPVSSIQEGGTSPGLKGTVLEPQTHEPLVLKNKAPRWHEQLQCWCLNFKGRVTVASVKNFQLVAAVDSRHNVSPEEQERVILQFGKIGKDIFTMDYCYPLSAFQAFAICLSSFDTKPACE